MKPLKDARLALRLPQALKERLARMEERTGIPPTILAVEGLTAICAFYEANGVVTMPFSIVPTPEAKAPPDKPLSRRKAAAKREE